MEIELSRDCYTEMSDGIARLARALPRFSPAPRMETTFARLRAPESIGRPLGDERFMARLERLTKRRLRPGKRGPKSQLSALSP